MRDEAFFYIALSQFVADNSFSQRKGDPEDAIRYRMESMRIVHDRLRKLKSQISDGTIGTVAILANYEVRFIFNNLKIYIY